MDTLHEFAHIVKDDLGGTFLFIALVITILAAVCFIAPAAVLWLDRKDRMTDRETKNRQSDQTNLLMMQLKDAVSSVAIALQGVQASNVIVCDTVRVVSEKLVSSDERTSTMLTMMDNIQKKILSLPDVSELDSLYDRINTITSTMLTKDDFHHDMNLVNQAISTHSEACRNQFNQVQLIKAAKEK